MDLKLGGRRVLDTSLDRGRGMSERTPVGDDDCRIDPFLALADCRAYEPVPVPEVGEEGAQP